MVKEFPCTPTVWMEMVEVRCDAMSTWLLSLSSLQFNLIAKSPVILTWGGFLPGLGSEGTCQMGTMVQHCPLVDTHALTHRVGADRWVHSGWLAVGMLETILVAWPLGLGEVAILAC